MTVVLHDRRRLAGNMLRSAPVLGAIGWLTLAACWFFTIQSQPLFEPDEGRYAEIPREMWSSGDWVTPRLDEIKYFEKPPLQYWATAVAYSAFGVSEWSSRLWAFWLAFACIPLTYAFARAMYGTRVGVAAALTLCMNPLYVVVGHFNLLDSAFTFFTTAAIFSFVMSRHASSDPLRERRWMLSMWASLACAILTKGIAVVVLMGATVVVYSVLARDARVWRRWHAGVGLPLLLLLTVPWFATVTLRNPDFPRFFFVHEHIARFLTTVHDRVGPWWYFLPLVVLAVAPWIPRLGTSLRMAWQGRPNMAAPDMTGRFLVVWCVLVLLFFSASQSKLPPYILPAMPALSVLLALAVDDAAVRRAGRINSGLLALLAAGMAGLAWHRFGLPLPRMLGWTAAALLASALGVLLIHRTGPMWSEPRRALGLACVSIIGWQALIMTYAALTPARTALPLVKTVSSSIAPGEAIYSVGEYRQSVAPYLGRTLRLVAYRGEFDFGLRHDTVPYLATLGSFMSEWQQHQDAVAFVSPEAYAELVRRDAPMRRLASDDRSVVISRRLAPVSTANASTNDVVTWSRMRIVRPARSATHHQQGSRLDRKSG
jgi:4-amino-4-deoxy-L-arabinose transferase-like glycosyltransferase